jgi:hypothetical protein
MCFPLQKNMAKKISCTLMFSSFISFLDYACGFRCASCNGKKNLNLHVL